MKKWLKKITVMTVAIITLGFYVPSTGMNTSAEADDNKNPYSSKSDVERNPYPPNTAVEKVEFTHYEDFTVPLKVSDYIFIDISEKAKELTYMKLGPRILSEIEDEFSEVVFPAMEKTLQTVLQQADEKDLPYYKVTKEPSNGLGERIFHLTDERTDEDLMKFHVRRDHRPWEGYSFNFHYHMSDDQFERHYVIGDIYWDKNKPPQWMS